MSLILENNIKLIEKHQPQLYKKITAHIKGRYAVKDNTVERVLLAKQDDLIINMLVYCQGKEFLICNHEDPISQSYQWIDKYIDPSNRSYIVFGMGFGFHLEVLLTSFKDKKVMVIEPNIDLFYQIITVRNLELVITKAELIVDEDIDYILARLYSLFWDTEKGGIQCMPLEVYAEMFPTQWDELRHKLIKQAESFSVDMNTKKFFGELWINNYIKNSEVICHAANAGGLSGKFKGVPGILVSAGPSLNKNVHLLNGLSESCVIMAGGTAVNILEDFGVTPHFMMGIDASIAEGDIHKKVKSKEIFFLYSNQVARESLQHYEGPKFLMNYSADTFTENFFKKWKVDSQMFLSGPSVSNTCFDMLYKMGCNPIIIIGQDMAYTGRKMYGGNQLSEHKEMTIDELSNEGCFIEKDIYGNDVYTNQGYKTIKYWFEGYFEKVRNEVEIVNATEGGLGIEFAVNCSLQDAIDRYCGNTFDVTKKIKEIHNEELFGEAITEKLSKYRHMLMEDLESIEKDSKKQLELVDLIKRDVYHPSKNKKAFDRMAFRIAEFIDRVLVSDAYNILLKHVLSIEFFLIKKEVDMATKELTSYEEVKDFYINAIVTQNSLLSKVVNRVKDLLKT